MRASQYSAAVRGSGFTKAMSIEYGRYNVTSNAVAPGIIETEMAMAVSHYSEIKEKAIQQLPIRRLGIPQDVADAILFLSSERASYISGEVLHVTGGRYG